MAQFCPHFYRIFLVLILFDSLDETFVDLAFGNQTFSIILQNRDEVDFGCFLSLVLKLFDVINFNSDIVNFLVVLLCNCLELLIV